MKKTVTYLCLLTIVACLTACGDKELREPDFVETYTLRILETAEAPKPVEYSPLATEHFLTPLEDYSWEREFAPEYVMIHFTSAVVAEREAPYDLDAVRRIFVDGGVSIHYILDRDGKIDCYIPETRAAWHAGKGSFAEDDRLTNAMNKYAIGIELVGIGSKADMAQYLSAAEYAALEVPVGFTDAQYASLDALVEDICTRNGIPRDRAHIIGHAEYNPTKTDPGELFDWSRILK